MEIVSVLSVSLEGEGVLNSDGIDQRYFGLKNCSPGWFTTFKRGRLHVFANIGQPLFGYYGIIEVIQIFR
jgi:hypothetical protein